MFSLRRKPTKSVPETKIRVSPSLPELNSQGIPWPENLVDVSSIKSIPPISEHIPKGATPTSFQGTSQSPIPFHKPFRSEGATSISALYMSNAPPSSFADPTTKNTPRISSKYSQRRARAPPTFNLMVSSNSRFPPIPPHNIHIL